MYVTQLMPLLVKGTFTPGSVTTIATLCDDWFQDEASLVSFGFRSVFFDLRAATGISRGSRPPSSTVSWPRFFCV